MDFIDSWSYELAKMRLVLAIVLSAGKMLMS